MFLGAYAMKGQTEARHLPEEDQDDSALMLLAASGDQRAFQKLMQRHLVKTVRLAARMLGSEAHAEDVVQEAFIRVWRHAPSWEDTGTAGAKFTTWLYKIVLRLCIDQKRKNRFVAIDDLPERADGTPDAEAGMETDEKRKRVKAVLQDLPERQRAAVVLSFYNELSNQETAEALGISVKAVESLLVRARRTLRDELQEEKP